VIWGNFFTEVRAPGTLLGTPKFGMLGAGIAQALGAKAADRARQVYCITGDGAMGFHPQEVETAVRNGLNVIFLVVSDKQWGMVKMNQSFQLRPVKTLVMGHLDEGENINADLGEIEWAKLGQSMGAHGERASDPDALDAAIDRAIASGKPAVIHVDVDPVKHMWAPALRHFKDMHAEPRG
jgi:acetolactate synthase-1/2/3 large subunit